MCLCMRVRVCTSHSTITHLQGTSYKVICNARCQMWTCKPSEIRIRWIVAKIVGPGFMGWPASLHMADNIFIYLITLSHLSLSTYTIAIYRHHFLQTSRHLNSCIHLTPHHSHCFAWRLTIRKSCSHYSNCRTCDIIYCWHCGMVSPILCRYCWLMSDNDTTNT